MRKIEFYGTPDGTILYYEEGEAPKVLNAETRELISLVLSHIKIFKEPAYKALCIEYAKYKRNKRYFEFMMVHRYIQCNLREHDTLSYDIEGDKFNCEEVSCPLRGECQYEGIICKTKTTSILSPREQDVAKLLVEGQSLKDIAEDLFISIYTVQNHVASIKKKWGIKNIPQIIAMQNYIQR